MTNILIALVPIGLILLSSEILWRRKIIKDEIARKFIHILAGCWMAFWPYYLPFEGIFILGCIALALILYSRFTRLFHAIYSVRRKTYGDIFFAVAIVVCAFLAQEDWVFMVSILLLALADGAAAIAGQLWGSGNTYQLFGSKYLRKSRAGTTAFVVCTYLALGLGWLLGGEMYMSDMLVLTFVLLPLAATTAENVMPVGLDNLVTPVITVLILNSLVL